MGDLVFIFIVGTIWCLAFESPFLAIAKLLNRKGNNMIMMIMKDMGYFMNLLLKISLQWLKLYTLETKFIPVASLQTYLTILWYFFYL